MGEETESQSFHSQRSYTLCTGFLLLPRPPSPPAYGQDQIGLFLCCSGALKSLLVDPLRWSPSALSQSQGIKGGSQLPTPTVHQNPDSGYQGLSLDWVAGQSPGLGLVWLIFLSPLAVTLLPRT